MSEFRLSFPACLIAGKNRLAAEDLLTLSSVTFPVGVRTSEDAVILLALQNSCPEKCAGWDAFFIEALTDFIVHYCYPQGSLDEINAAWLVRMLSTDGAVNSPLELELLLHAIEVSASVPSSLAAFALDQLRLAIEEDIGAYRLIRPADGPGITRHDLDYTHRILRDAVGRERIVLSFQEISVLRRIDAATAACLNHPGWHALMAAIEMCEEDSLRRGPWLRLSHGMPAVEDAA
jgi:hypothetical protein